VPLLTTFSGVSARGLGLTSGGIAVVTGYSAVNTYGSYTSFKFNSTGTMNISGSAAGDVFLVNGGQGGYSAQWTYCFKDCGTAYGGGYGGSGSALYTFTNSLFTPGSYAVTIGAGGAGGTSGSTAGWGGTSSIVGGALNITGGTGQNGSAYGVYGYTYGGAQTQLSLGAFGGGPGAGGSGGSAVDSGNPGDGGIGSTNTYWDGTSIYYGGGGAGGSTSGTLRTGGSGGGGGTAVAGSANTGGGGGGNSLADSENGANGGSGIIIIRFLKDSVIAG
jgi:hypothetical protein